MKDYSSLTTEQIELLVDENTLTTLRKLQSNSDPGAYRAALLRVLDPPVLPVEDVLAAIREHPEPSVAWAEILNICRRCVPTAAWNRFPQPDFAQDIEAASLWINEHIRRKGPVTGICLALDTLNMREGEGQNIIIGSSSECDPLQDRDEWINGDDVKYGDDHLIWGLVDLHQEYSGKDWRVQDDSIFCRSAYAFADYIIFLGYSGVVLAQAVQRIPIANTLLIAWGFAGNDMFLLGRKTPDAYVSLCKNVAQSPQEDEEDVPLPSPPK